MGVDFELSEIIKNIDSHISNNFGHQENSIHPNFVSFNGKYYASVRLQNVKELGDLRKALIEFDPVSIDAFLNYHPKYAEAGKIMIIYSLLKCENEDDFSRKENIEGKTDPDNWYSYLINDILSGCNKPTDIKNNKIDIITFNYSMSLDYYLKKRLSAVGILVESNEAQEFIEELTIQKIHHVYGKIHEAIPIGNYGELGDLKKDKKPIIKNTVRFFRSVNFKNLIRLMYEKRHVTDTYKELIENAKKIIFIGFGFDRENLNVLGLPEVGEKWVDILRQCKQIQVMDFDGKMKNLSHQFEALQQKYDDLCRGGLYPLRPSRLSVNYSTAKSITTAYQNDFKIRLY